VAVFAAVVGFTLFSSGYVKAITGWLALEDSSVQGAQLRNLIVYGRDALLSPLTSQIDSAWIWEPADWLTVIMESSMLVLPFFPRLMALGLAAMTGLHLGIVLTMNIAFEGNVMVYTLFMRWPRGVLDLAHNAAAVCARVSTPLALLLGLVAAGLTLLVGSPNDVFRRVLGNEWFGVLIIGLGLAFMLTCLLRPAPRE
jgi:hypothetical protein